MRFTYALRTAIATDLRNRRLLKAERKAIFLRLREITTECEALRTKVIAERHGVTRRQVVQVHEWLQARAASHK